MISINHLKRTIRKSQLIPYFLEGDSFRKEIKELAGYYDSLKGMKYKEFTEEKIVEIVGDYKLAKSFQSVLNNFYLFKPIPFDDVVNLRDMKSYSDLRLYVFSLLEKGFSSDKKEVYDKANKDLKTNIDFDNVLWLDHPGNRILHKIKDFDIGVFIRLYNLGVFETLFLNSTMISFKLNGFDKKIFWICKQNRLLWDISKVNDKFILKIFGPSELLRTNYGYRIAKAVPKLIGYAEELTAFLRIKNKERLFSISSQKYNELIKEKEILTEDEDVKEQEKEDDIFDSFSEQEFFNKFKSNDYGWKIEREPEPIIQKDIVFVPDFCIKRSKSKVFVEIIGFWTKEYQEKKLWKLSKLKDINLILIVSSKYEKEIRKKLEELGYPTIYHDFNKRGSIVSAVLNILERDYSDFKERFSEIASDQEIQKQINDSVNKKGFILIPKLKKLFNTFSNEEFRKIFVSYKDKIDGVLIANAGFFSQKKLNELKQIIVRFNGKSREGLVQEIEEEMNPYVDPLLNYSGYSVRWKSLGETEIVKK